jgi:hypothetical protein
LLKTALDGALALGAKPTFDFKFSGEVPSAVKLADAFQITGPARAWRAGQAHAEWAGVRFVRRHHAEDRRRTSMKARC